MWSDLDDAAAAAADDSDDGEADAGWRADKHGTHTTVFFFFLGGSQKYLIAYVVSQDQSNQIF